MDEEWEALRETWTSYRGAVEAWLEVSNDSGADAELADGVTHLLIGYHNEWERVLTEMLAKTHRH